MFIRVAVVRSQICEILQNSERIRTYSTSRSSKVIELSVNRRRIRLISHRITISATRSFGRGSCI